MLIASLADDSNQIRPSELQLVSFTQLVKFSQMRTDHDISPSRNPSKVSSNQSRLYCRPSSVSDLYQNVYYDFPDTPEGQLAEEEIHRKHAGILRDQVLRHCELRQEQGGDRELWNLNVRCFLMDLRGSVRMLITDGENYDF